MGSLSRAKLASGLSGLIAVACLSGGFAQDRYPVKDAPAGGVATATGSIADSVQDLPMQRPQSLLDSLVGSHLIVPVSFKQKFCSKGAQAGQEIECVLCEDMLWAGKTVIRAGSTVIGHVQDYVPPRTLVTSVFSSDRRFDSRACLAIHFDKIIDSLSEKVIPMEGALCRQQVHGVDEHFRPREVTIDGSGRIVKAEGILTKAQQVGYTSVRAATMIPVPVTMIVSAATAPFVMGFAGAVSPSFAYNKPLDEDVAHPRLKGFTYGFLTNLPGAPVVQAFVEKGDDLVINPGDRLMLDVCLKSTECSHPFAMAPSRRLYPLELPKPQSKFRPYVPSPDDTLDDRVTVARPWCAAKTVWGSVMPGASAEGRAKN